MTTLTNRLAVAMLLAIAATVGAVGCGSSSGTSSSSSPTSVTGSAAERAEAILGHAPTGLAKTIVDSGSIEVANDANYPPQSSVDPATKEIVGFDVDVAKKMGEILGLNVVFTHPTWDTIPAGLTGGRFDVSIGSMTVTSEREKTLDFTDPYYYSSGQVFVRKGGTQITGVDDLIGQSVGVVSNTTYYDFLKKSGVKDIKTYQNDVDLSIDLLNGNVDYMMTAGPTGQEMILKGKAIDFSGTPLYYEDLAMAIKKDEPDLLALLNYAVAKMHEDGSLTKMSKEWYNGVDLTVKQ